MKACPFCAEQIQDAAIVCRYCQRDLPASTVPAPAQTSQGAPSPAVPPQTQRVQGVFALLASFGGIAGTIWLLAGGAWPVPVGPIRSGSAKYRITGSAKSCSATYQNENGSSSQEVVTIPWTFDLDNVSGGAFLYVACQIDGPDDRGSIEVSILKDGAVFKSGRAEGFPNIATASGSF